MNLEREKICYNALLRVYRDEGFSNLILDEVLTGADGEEEFITRLFYGVLEKSIALDYIIGKLADKKPKLSIIVVLKMGIYMLRYMNVADYAVVDKCVELTKIIGKAGAAGFVNAVLRRAGDIVLPQRGECSDLEFLSLNCSLPKWLTGLLLKQYPAEFIENMMSYSEHRTHIRLNPNAISSSAFESALKKFEKIEESKTFYGYYVTHSTLKKIKREYNLSEKDYTVQSLASIIAANCYADGLSTKSRVLDLCAAPGGKAVYLRQTVGCEILACDVHPHRIKLIESYARRMGVALEIALNDACVLREEWREKFDCVICDVPCSGLGDLHGKPDVLLRKSYETIVELSKLQKKIIAAAAAYVKPGGKLCYSTCTIVRQENEEVVADFLTTHLNFELFDAKQTFNNVSGINAVVDAAREQTASVKSAHGFVSAHAGYGREEHDITAQSRALHDNNVREHASVCSSFRDKAATGSEPLERGIAARDYDDSHNAVRKLASGCSTVQECAVSNMAVQKVGFEHNAIDSGNESRMCGSNVDERVGYEIAAKAENAGSNYDATHGYEFNEKEIICQSPYNENDLMRQLQNKCLRLFPHTDHTDGFFIAVMRRKG